MIIGLLVCTIGLIPIVLALTVHQMYKGLKLSSGLFIYMILITLWQLNIGVLYFNEILPESLSLFLFRLFRAGPTFSVLAVYYIAHVTIENYSSIFKEHVIVNKILKIVFNKKAFFILIIWSLVIYIINWTKLGIVGLTTVELGPHMSFYFPEYGVLDWTYKLHVGSFLFFLIIVYFIARQIQNSRVRSFLIAFTLNSVLLFVTGFLNFKPETGVLTSSMGVIFFSTMIMIRFVKLNTDIELNYQRLMERQKKLDFTGNLAGSLIHEVKNTNTIIKGYSKLLNKDNASLNERQNSSLEMITQATEHLDGLTNNYREYMKNHKMDFRMEDLVLIIKNAIEFSKEMARDHEVEVEFHNNYNSLMMFANKTYLQQVFINLIKNSSEAIPEDRKNRKITIRTNIEDDFIIIDLIDTGKGIPLQNRESIFDPFISFTSRGMGMGLPFVKKVIFEHRGDIDIVHSSPEGTHFQIKFSQF